ncbi:MAG: hypothetical protein WCC37_05790 [Candidatus Sulfotelmatobacter sp.]|jgi:hypothetical protein
MLSKPAGIGHGEKRSRKKELAIGCLLAFPTVRAAAKAAGIHEITLHRWLKERQFAFDYQRARERVLETASEQLRSGTLQAVEVLREVAANRKAPAASRVQAARSFLEATGLLKGAAVTVNNSVNVPQDSESVMEAIRVQLGAMLRTDAALRETVKAILSEVEDVPTVQ